MSPALTFNADRHEYAVRGRVVPSVTQIVKSVYDFSMIDPVVLESKRQLGVAVHLAVQLDIDNRSPVAVVEQVAGYLGAWLQFRWDLNLHEADFGEVEKPLYSELYGYAGTPDMTLCIDRSWAVLDIKTAASLHPAWALQTAGYQQLVNEHTESGHHKIRTRYSLRLRSDGTYRLDEFKDRNDWPAFLAFLAVHRWREAHLQTIPTGDTECQPFFKKS